MLCRHGLWALSVFIYAQCCSLLTSIYYAWLPCFLCKLFYGSNFFACWDMSIQRHIANYSVKVHCIFWFNWNEMEAFGRSTVFLEYESASSTSVEYWSELALWKCSQLLLHDGPSVYWSWFRCDICKERYRVRRAPFSGPKMPIGGRLPTFDEFKEVFFGLLGSPVWQVGIDVGSASFS